MNPNFKILGAAYPYFAKRLMEDTDPQLRLSLKEMIFEGEALKWTKLEDLVKSATSQSELNIESLLDQSIDFIFSKNGKIMRNEIVNSIVKKIDEFNWKTILSINTKLPKGIQSRKLKINNYRKEVIINTKEKKSILNKLRTVPGFKIRFIVKKLPRIISEPDTRIMGINIAKGVLEKSFVRLIKTAAGVKQ